MPRHRFDEVADVPTINQPIHKFQQTEPARMGDVVAVFGADGVEHGVARVHPSVLKGAKNCRPLARLGEEVFRLLPDTTVELGDTVVSIPAGRRLGSSAVLSLLPPEIVKSVVQAAHICLTPVLYRNGKLPWWWHLDRSIVDAAIGRAVDSSIVSLGSILDIQIAGEDCTLRVVLAVPDCNCSGICTLNNRGHCITVNASDTTRLVRIRHHDTRIAYSAADPSPCTSEELRAFDKTSAYQSTELHQLTLLDTVFAQKSPRAALVEGPAGVGKTELVKKYAANRGLQLFSFNCGSLVADHDNARTGASVLAAAATAAASGPDPAVLLVDDLDLLSENVGNSSISDATRAVEVAVDRVAKAPVLVIGAARKTEAVPRRLVQTIFRTTIRMELGGSRDRAEILRLLTAPACAMEALGTTEEEIVCCIKHGTLCCYVLHHIIR